ncbi:MAG TPA: hypothetical protein VF407_05040 [Polyangiaceae bacterium]
MEYEHSILRALLRLARRRAVADGTDLMDRVGGTQAELRDALRRLEASGFVDRRSDTDVRLTMPGFAIAVASVAGRRSGNKPAARPARRSRAA